MTLPASDNFTNNTGSNLVLTTYSANWTFSSGSFIVVNAASNVYSHTSGDEGGAYWNADTFSADQYSQCTLSSLSSGIALGVGVRMTGSGKYYGLYVEGTTYYLFYRNGATWTQFATGTISLKSTDVLRLEVTGTNPCALVMKKNGTQFGSTYNDSASGRYTSGSAGITGYGDNIRPRLDNWQGGNISSNAYVLVANSGTYSVSGQSATLLKSKQLVASNGTYSVTGQDATFTYSRKLIADAGAYNISGQDATILKSRVIAAANAEYLINGQYVDIVKSGTPVVESEQKFIEIRTFTKKRRI